MERLAFYGRTKVICDDAEKTITAVEPLHYPRRFRKTIYRITAKNCHVSIGDGYFTKGTRLYLVIKGRVFYDFAVYGEDGYATVSGGGMELEGDMREIPRGETYVLTLDPHSEVFCIWSEDSSKSFMSTGKLDRHRDRGAQSVTQL